MIVPFRGMRDGPENAASSLLLPVIVMRISCRRLLAGNSLIPLDEGEAKILQADQDLL
jgi:hypothetical protein